MFSRSRLAPPPPPPPPPCLPNATWICRNVASARSKYCRAFCSGVSALLNCWLLNWSAAGPIASTAFSISSVKLLNAGLFSESCRAFIRAASDFAWSRSLPCTSERYFALSAVGAFSLPFSWFHVAAITSFCRSEIFCSSSPWPPPPPPPACDWEYSFSKGCASIK